MTAERDALADDEQAAVELAESGTALSLDVDPLNELKETALAFWSDAAVKNDHAFHPSLLWRFIDETRARLGASSGRPEQMSEAVLTEEGPNDISWEDNQRRLRELEEDAL